MYLWTKLGVTTTCKPSNMNTGIVKLCRNLFEAKLAKYPKLKAYIQANLSKTNCHYTLITSTSVGVTKFSRNGDLKSQPLYSKSN